MEVDAENEEGDDCEAAMVNLLECLLPYDLLVSHHRARVRHSSSVGSFRLSYATLPCPRP